MNIDKTMHIDILWQPNISYYRKDKQGIVSFCQSQQFDKEDKARTMRHVKQAGMGRSGAENQVDILDAERQQGNRDVIWNSKMFRLCCSLQRAVQVKVKVVVLQTKLSLTSF